MNMHENDVVNPSDYNSPDIAANRRRMIEAGWYESEEDIDLVSGIAMCVTSYLERRAQLDGNWDREVHVSLVPSDGEMHMEFTVAIDPEEKPTE